MATYSIGHLQILETERCRCIRAQEHGRDGEHGSARVSDSNWSEAAIAYCRARNGHRLIVSTAAADIGNLRFYQRQGFRMYKIVRDAFAPSMGYPEGTLVDGIPLRDQVFLDLDLNG